MRVLENLSTVLLREQEALLRNWRTKVGQLPGARALEKPQLNDHVPTLVVELAKALRDSEPGEVADGNVNTPPAHGMQRFEDGFDIAEVVAEYSAMRGCVLDLAERHDIVLRGAALRILNDVLDGAIGAAVRTFAEREALEEQRRRERYLAFVAHDLRTPLSAIRIATGILELRWPGAASDLDAARMLKTLSRNVSRLDALVEDVLEENTHLLTEHGIQLERRTFDLWPMVERVLQDLHPVALQRDTRLVNQVPDELSVYSDASMAGRILENLVANAIEYTAGGMVVVGAREDTAAGVVECWVADDGVGIAADRLDKVFEAFHTDPARDGVGLGLAIVRAFVEAHGGKAWVESTEGEGSTFRFTLPLSTTVAGRATA